MAKKFLQYIIAALAMMVAAPTLAGGPPKVLEIRAVKETPEVQMMQELRMHRTIPVSYMWDVSQAARKGMPGVTFVSGLKASIKVEGLKPELNLFGKEFPIVDRNTMTIGSVKASAAGSGYVEFHDLDLRDGAISVILGDIFDPMKKLPVVTVKPTGWKGAGISWDEAGGYFRASYAHRMDNSAIMPEIRVVK